MFDSAPEEPDAPAHLSDADLIAAHERHADEHGLAGIAHLEGCAELATWLASVDPAQVGAFDLVEIVAGFERVAAWAKARAAAAAAELAARPEMNPTPRPSDVGGVARSAAGTELSLRLGISPYASSRLLTIGQALSRVLQATGDALDAGDIDWGKATVIADALTDVPWQVAQAVEQQVLPHAPLRTHSQLRRELARALAEADPRDATERHTRAAQHRRVDHPRVLPDGMATIRAILPADAAVRLDATLHSAARTARATGDPRTLDQLRADALDAMATTAWNTGWIGTPPTIDASSAPGGTAHHDDDEPQTDTTRSHPTPGTGGHPPLRIGTVGGRRAQVRVTVGYGTLLGLDERPAELDGYGPITADVARRIAAEGTWRRLLVDPRSGAVLDVGRTRYRPPPDMIEHVTARNPWCVIPTCSAPAHTCDIDHTVPFAAGGHTDVANLGPGCRRHHSEKTHGWISLTQPAPGHFHTRTITGHHYDQPPSRPPGVPLTDQRTRTDDTNGTGPDGGLEPPAGGRHGSPPPDEPRRPRPPGEPPF